MTAYDETTLNDAGTARIVALAYAGAGDSFTRADLVFAGVDHAGSSYEVRVFLNRVDVAMDTPREPAAGYAGRIHVFGHGGCFGDLGHCDVPELSLDPTDLRPPHQLTPLTTFLTVTEPLRRLLGAGAGLTTVTLLPIGRPPRRADRAPDPELFRFQSVDLQTYRTPPDLADG
uniref:hypothetical protein n=1 Tax=Paractinoplanes polyasparticus TaxID=2856853 RepID=UPI001C84E3C5|nr:hypothetical protein [Actinoplanes polyasparticus]